jgi:C-terminal processing protease CtpA/Prc
MERPLLSTFSSEKKNQSEIIQSTHPANSFYSKNSLLFQARKIKSAGVRNLIIDVRNNDGGNSLLGEALIDMFNAKSYLNWASKWKRSVFYAEHSKRGNIPLPASRRRTSLPVYSAYVMGRDEILETALNLIK